MFWYIIYKNGFSLGNNLLLSLFLWGEGGSIERGVIYG